MRYSIRGTLSATEGSGCLNYVHRTRGGTNEQNWQLDSRGNWLQYIDNGTVRRNLYTDQDAKGLEHEDANGVTDTWNRLAYRDWTESKAYSYSGPGGSGGGTTTDKIRQRYTYDALGRIVRERKDVDNTARELNDYYYSAAWQSLYEIRRHVPAGTTDWQTSEHENVWSLAYVDAMVFEDQYTGESTPRTRTRIYSLADTGMNVTALVTLQDGTWQVGKRYRYKPYGAVIELKRDASVDGPTAFSGVWQYLHKGGRYTSADGLYHFRNRSYDPYAGHWLQRDPAGYTDGLNLYEYLGEIWSEAVDDGRKSVAYPWCCLSTGFQRGKGYATWTRVRQRTGCWQWILPAGRLGTC